MGYYADYIEAGFRIIALHGEDNGLCGCGDPDCKAVLKHPRASNWQYTPHWSDEQIDTMVEYGVFNDGYGVLVDDHLIIDVDPRSGGYDAYKRLQDELGLNLTELSNFVVETGGGGLHVYFNREASTALVTHLKGFDGIDFKSSGFVVGAGSRHASGLTYEIQKGGPDDINDAPPELIALLTKKDRYRTKHEGNHIDISDTDIREMLEAFKNDDIHYEDWIRVGMAIHDATSGGGFHLWDEWSKTSSKYDPHFMDKKWHSFGKSTNQVTIGTLFHFAEEAGYRPSVTFEYEPEENFTPSNLVEVDLCRPPGFVGQVTEWINSQCRFPREHLAVAAALSAVGNICGGGYLDESFGATPNNFIFCVAGSATGKEAIQQAQARLHQIGNVAPATHGAIKSEQEIIRNLINHQSSLYIVDEMGLVLQKIQNARNRGGAAYLEGVIGTLMSAYSKANGVMLLSGDVREETRGMLSKEVAKLRKLEDEHDKDYEKEITRLERKLETLDHGLENPFLSLIGFTTPVTFNSLVDYEQSVNGFFGRALVVHEKDTNPKAKKNFKPRDMEMMFQASLSKLNREIGSPQLSIKTTGDALELLDEISDQLFYQSEKAKEISLEAIPRRAFELILKVSLVLAIPSGLRTVEHVRWAHAFVNRDIDQKMNLAASNMATEERRHDEALLRKIIQMLDKEKPEKTGVITNRLRTYSKADVLQALDKLKNLGRIRSEEGARKSTNWYLAIA